VVTGNRNSWVFHNGFLKNLKKTPEKNRENSRCGDKKIQKLKYESRPRKMSLDAIMMRVMMRWDWLQSQMALAGSLFNTEHTTYCPFESSQLTG
jgi:hypothetical protein